MRVYTYTGNPFTISETAGSTHGLGVAAKGAAPGDPWANEAGASFSIDTNTSAGGTNSESVSNGRYLFNRVYYRQYKHVCQGVGVYRIDRYQARSSGFDDIISEGDEYSPVSRPIWSNCSTRKTSGTFWKRHGSSATFAQGVTLLGISVSAHASYETNTQIAWTFNTPGYLCGSNTTWPDATEAQANIG